MNEGVSVRSNLIFLIIVSFVFICGCFSYPKIATISQKGRTLHLMAGKNTYPNEFLSIKQVKISSDKKQLLIIPDEGSKILMDSTGIIDISNIKPGLESKPDQIYNSGNLGRSNAQRFSSDGKYLTEVNFIFFKWKSLTITEKANGNKQTIEAGLGKMVGPYYAGKNDKLYIHFVGGDHNLELYDLKTSQKINTIPIAYSGDTLSCFESMSSDIQNDILVMHSLKLIQFYKFSTGELLGNMLILNQKDWVLVSPDGNYDGTPNAVKLLAWVDGQDQINLSKFESVFYTKGLFDKIMNLSMSTNSKEVNTIAGKYVGKVRKVKGNEIVISYGSAGDNIKIGDSIFVVIDGKKYFLKITFPMMTSAKCSLEGNQNIIIPVDTTVFK